MPFPSAQGSGRKYYVRSFWNPTQSVKTVPSRLLPGSVLFLALHLIEWVTFICRLPQDKGPDLQGGSRLHWQIALCYGILCFEP